MVEVSNLFIDKLCLAYRCRRDTGQGITATIRGLQESQEVSIHYLGPYYQNRGYRNNWHICALGDNHNSRVLVMTDPVRNPEAAYFMLEWNPRILGLDGNNELWEILQQILLDDFVDYLNTALITRIDFSVDVRPMSPEAILVAADSLRRGDTMTGDHGEIQSINLGSRGNKTSYCIYNRDSATRERISSNRFVTRIESRNKPIISLPQLHSIAISNPFKKLLIANSVDPIDLENAPDRYKLFLDSVYRRGLQGALQLFHLPETKRRYKRWIENNFSPDWYDPDHIWNGYNNAFSALALEEYLGPQRYCITNGKRVRYRPRNAISR